jgi:hypothetical protein
MTIIAEENSGTDEERENGVEGVVHESRDISLHTSFDVSRDGIVRHVSTRVRGLELPPILYVEGYERYTRVAATLVDACPRVST